MNELLKAKLVKALEVTEKQLNTELSKDSPDLRAVACHTKTVQGIKKVLTNQITLSDWVNI